MENEFETLFWIIAIYIIGFLVGWLSNDLYIRNKTIKLQRETILKNIKKQDK